jgi:hypothetical protein
MEDNTYSSLKENIKIIVSILINNNIIINIYYICIENNSAWHSDKIPEYNGC